jgi:hypothetical protein
VGIRELNGGSGGFLKSELKASADMMLKAFDFRNHIRSQKAA